MFPFKSLVIFTFLMGKLTAAKTGLKGKMKPQSSKYFLLWCFSLPTAESEVGAQTFVVRALLNRALLGCRTKSFSVNTPVLCLQTERVQYRIMATSANPVSRPSKRKGSQPCPLPFLRSANQESLEVGSR